MIAGKQKLLELDAKFQINASNYHSRFDMDSQGMIHTEYGFAVSVYFVASVFERSSRLKTMKMTAR